MKEKDRNDCPAQQQRYREFNQLHTPPSSLNISFQFAVASAYEVLFTFKRS